MAAFVFVALCLLSFCNARTITWTAAGGNPLWNNAGNWDCQCLPTINDDVLIDHQLIPGVVQVGGVIAPALAKSLTLGGSSRFLQTLTLTGALTVGSGVSTLNSNGAISMQSAPEYPFLNGGTFNVHGLGFSFSSGTLGGQGKFVFGPDSTFNLTGAATKAFNTTVVVNGRAVTSGSSSANLVFNGGGSFTVAGSFVSAASLTMATDSKSTFTVTGNFTYTGQSLLFQGPGFNLGTWSLGGKSQATTANSFVSGSLNLDSGAVLTLIGAPTEKRTFDKITGQGTVQCQGGNNAFNAVAAYSLEASGGTISVKGATLNMLLLNGAYLGGTKITVMTATLTNGFINGGLQIAANNVVMNGIVEIDNDGTALMVSSNWNVPSTARGAQITMTGGSSIQFTAGSTVTQAASLQIVPGAPTANKPSISFGGAWSTSSALTVAEIPISGSGSFSLTSSATINLNNVVFSAKSISSQGTITTQVGSFTVDTITGTGTINTSPVNFNVNYLTTSYFTLNTGTATVTNATIGTMNLKNGVFSVAVDAKITTFSFQGGKVMGSGSTQAAVNVMSTSVTTAATQTINNVVLSTNSFTLDCGKQACQFFTQNASVKTVAQ